VGKCLSLGNQSSFKGIKASDGASAPPSGDQGCLQLLLSGSAGNYLSLQITLPQVSLRIVLLGPLIGPNTPGVANL
jgi:hypothetical protein